MIDPAICRGCDFWRKDSGGNFMCNYCVDVEGPFRTALGQLTVCNVRQVGGEIKPRIRSHKYDTARKPKAGVRYMELYRKGLTDRQISEATEASIFAVANWRQRNKLPPNKARKPVEIPEEKKGDPCQRCYSAEVCKRVGGMCNEKARWKR